MQTVAELPEYIRAADKLLSADERQDIIRYLAQHPKDGALMEGTGGVRKLRWRRGGQGKSGGVRVIYYYHDEAMPLYLLTLFAKGNRASLSKAERNELVELAALLVKAWRGRKT
jgi:hypothetical protein